MRACCDSEANVTFLVQAIPRTLMRCKIVLSRTSTHWRSRFYQSLTVITNEDTRPLKVDEDHLGPPRAFLGKDDLAKMVRSRSRRRAHSGGEGGNQLNAVQMQPR